MTTEHSDFIVRSEKKATDEVHRKKLLKVIGTYDAAVIGRKRDQFYNWEQARTKAGEVKQYTLSTLPELLEEFERKSAARGVTVLWARDSKEAQRHILEIVARHKARKVVKAKSMTTEEIHLNELLTEHGLEVLESDLGELIVQLAGEKPYHIVTPCMHKSKAEISQLFHEKLGIPLTDDARDLAMAARKHLRSAYTTADIGITGVNFLIADEGAMVMLENEGNGRLSMACPPVHVAIAGIEKMLPRLADLELFLPLLATSGTGQQITAYNSIVRGPRQPGEIDGPEFMYVILLDNGRTTLYSDPDFQESLRCIRCGACLNACPVYKTIGGHTYNTPYQGPIGSVITPHLKGSKGWNHLSFASSLCGACTDVCPVKIPLHHMLLKNRQRAHDSGFINPLWSIAIWIWAFFEQRRARVSFIRPVGIALLKAVLFFLPRSVRHSIPLPAKSSFSELWRKKR